MALAERSLLILCRFFCLVLGFSPTLVHNYALRLPRVLLDVNYESTTKYVFCAKKQILMVETALGLFDLFFAVESVALSSILLYSKHTLHFV